MDVSKKRSQHRIKNGDVILTYTGMLCMGKPQFDAVREMEDDPDFYKYALGVAYKIPSEETLRQRLDDIGSSLRRQIQQENVYLLRDNGICPKALKNGYIPVDMDVSPFDNSKTHKEGIPEHTKAAMVTHPCLHTLAQRDIWSMTNSTRENSTASAEHRIFSWKPLNSAARSQTENCYSGLIPEMIHLKTSAFCLKTDAISILSTISGKRGKNPGLPWQRNTVKIFPIQGTAKQFISEATGVTSPTAGKRKSYGTHCLRDH